MAGHCVAAKMVSQEGAEGKCIEKSADTGMGPTGTQGLLGGTMGWQATNNTENEQASLSLRFSAGESNVQ